MLFNSIHFLIFFPVVTIIYFVLPHRYVGLLTTPVHPTYSNHILPAKYQEMQEHNRRLCEKYDLGYFNYMYDQRFSTEDYANSDHLNPAGAEKFSKIINEDILNKYIHP